MVKTDLTDEEKKLIIEVLNNNVEPPPADDKTLSGTVLMFDVQYRKLA